MPGPAICVTNLIQSLNVVSALEGDVYQVLQWAWHEVKGEAMAVNEAEHTTGIVWKVWREVRLLRCEVGVTVVWWCCHTHTGNEVSSCVGRVVERLPSLCVCFGPADAVWFKWDCGLPVASQHSLYHSTHGFRHEQVRS